MNRKELILLCSVGRDQKLQTSSALLVLNNKRCTAFFCNEKSLSSIQRLLVFVVFMMLLRCDLEWPPVRASPLFVFFYEFAFSMRKRIGSVSG